MKCCALGVGEKEKIAVCAVERVQLLSVNDMGFFDRLQRGYYRNPRHRETKKLADDDGAMVPVGPEDIVEITLSPTPSCEKAGGHETTKITTSYGTIYQCQICGKTFK